MLAAGMAGGDVEKGAEVAGNAAAYNYLSHPEARRLQAINRLLEDDDTLKLGERLWSVG
ncbi:hypothetical protein [Larsenimonas rhizosphaerae]|uniref:hypothetical protein n=1 Tax=Larsenimonas rhizosphaerae TaxID=2944682 RepID=UPI0033135216